MRHGNSAIVLPVKSTQRAAFGRLSFFLGADMTLLDMAAIAKRYDTAVSHAMLHAVAVAKDRGSRWATA